MIIIDVTWLTMGIVWLVKFYISVHIGEAREIMLGKCAKLYYTQSKQQNKNFNILELHLCLFIALVICNWAVMLSILITIWCTFDAAGRSWVKMKKYQRSMRESESRFNYKRSGSMNRNWRQRFVIHFISLKLFYVEQKGKKIIIQQFELSFFRNEQNQFSTVVIRTIYKSFTFNTRSSFM